MFVRVPEPEYYDRVPLLVRAKFAELIKVGETIKDGLKTGKISYVAASSGSLVTLKNKREEIAAILYGGKKTTRSSSYSQVCSWPSQHSYHALYMQGCHPNNPPIYQNTKATYRNVQAPLYKNPPPNYQNPSSIYPNNPPPYKISNPYQGVGPNSTNV